MIDRLSQDFSFLQTAVDLREQRQQVLASNVANADTPNYKARDFRFGEALSNAMGQSLKLPDTPLALTSPRHIAGQAASIEAAPLLYRLPRQPSLDGNTVDMDTERVQFADNSVRYQADLTLISQRIKTMLAAVAQ
jgi:flagellar basal-body rod protein FlgB